MQGKRTPLPSGLSRPWPGPDGAANQIVAAQTLVGGEPPTGKLRVRAATGGRHSETRSSRARCAGATELRPERALGAAGAGGRNGAGSGRPDHWPPERQVPAPANWCSRPQAVLQLAWFSATKRTATSESLATGVAPATAAETRFTKASTFAPLCVCCTYQLRNVCSRLLDHEGRPFDVHAQGPAPGRQMAS